MKLIKFNSDKGIYSFELEQVETSFHAHPVVEIIASSNGKLQIETTETTYNDVVFAIINRNIKHKVTTNNDSIKLLMIECSPSFLNRLLNGFKIKLIQGLFVEKRHTNKNTLIDYLVQYYKHHEVPKTEKPRIATCLEYMNSSEADYKKMIEELSSQVYLSESRLSHLFKAEIGISMKKYLVWSRLKKAFQLFLQNEQVNLHEAALRSGFYDQAHLSKAFKQMLGMSPSKVYNSRMIQE